MINVDFGNLFTVELLHKFYTNKLCPDFAIAPSPQTQQLLNGHKAIVRQNVSKLYAGILSNGISVPLKPFVTVEPGLQFTFFMSLTNPMFVNYTNLPFSTSTGNIYYFTNRNNNVSNSKNFLSAKIPVYSAAKTYKPGDLVSNATGTIFSAIKSSDPAHTFNTTKTDHWVSIDTNQYLSAADALLFLPSVSSFQLTAPAASAIISVLGFDTAVSTYTKSVISKTINFPGTVPSFRLDLSSLDPGKYSLTVNGVQQWIYVNDALPRGNTFGVIDIFNDAAPAPSQLVDVNQVLKSPAYSISFLNRATIWKYTLVSTTAGTITGTANPYHFTNSAHPPAASIFTSNTPIPLTDQALKFALTLGGHVYNLIPCADPQRLTSITQAGDIYSCSEIFLNH